MRNFITITKEEKDEKLAESLRSREIELLGYDFELESHQQAVTALGNIEWKDENREYKGLTRDQMIARAQTNKLTSEQISEISDLLSKDKHLHEIEAVTHESAISERHYDAILVALPEGKDRDDAILKVKAKEDAEKKKRLGLTDTKADEVAEVEPVKEVGEIKKP